MAKRLKFDETGDSDELQALFDSIASERVQPMLEVVDDKADDGDNDELQALFDAVAEEFGDSVAADPTAAALAADVDAGGDDAGEISDKAAGGSAVFNRIGKMTRQLHDALRQLGYDQALQEAAEAIPDARQRLTYIAQMTEQAASRVLNATDVAKPIQDKLQGDAADLESRWEKVYAQQASVDDFKVLAGETRQFLGQVREGSRATGEQLMEIMMAQDFQDLTGQVIKRTIGLVGQVEEKLVGLVSACGAITRGAPSKVAVDPATSHGPAVRADDAVINHQDDVDELLADLGF